MRPAPLLVCAVSVSVTIPVNRQDFGGMQGSSSCETKDRGKVFV